VKVKVILTGNADVYLIKYAERYIYQWMFRNGIEVYEYTKNVLHGKIAVCDGQWMTVGSFNVNNLSAFASIELNLEVNNLEFARHVEQRLEHIIAHDCVRITKENFMKGTNILVRAGRRAAYEVFRFLFFLSTRQAG
jgi:cardiolipin synthase A/B